MKGAYLLDVNALLALHDPVHVHHRAARAWFAEEGQQAWATCPITENGFVRIASHPSYPNPMGGVQGAILRVLRFREVTGHQFWTDDVTICDVLEPNALITQAHVTDVYLLALAIKNGGKLATFDGRMPVRAVRGGREAIEILTV